jgi:hypothetical protein
MFRDIDGVSDPAKDVLKIACDSSDREERIRFERAAYQPRWSWLACFGVHFKGRRLMSPIAVSVRMGPIEASTGSVPTREGSLQRCLFEVLEKQYRWMGISEQISVEYVFDVLPAPRTVHTSTATHRLHW